MMQGVAPEVVRVLFEVTIMLTSDCVRLIEREIRWLPEAWHAMLCLRCTSMDGGCVADPTVHIGHCIKQDTTLE